MKELNPILPDPKEQVAYIPKELQGMGEIAKPHKGMKLFGVDYKTMKAHQVKPIVTSLPVYRKYSEKAMNSFNALPQTEIHHQIKFNPDHWYCWAINESNAIRKYRLEIKNQGIHRQQ